MSFDPALTQVPPHTVLGGPEHLALIEANKKLGLDEQFDNRREVAARQRAWEEINLRRASNAAVIDNMVHAATHAAGVGAILHGQVAVTEGQQTVSPAGTAASEAIKGAVGVAGATDAVSAAAVGAAIGNLATALGVANAELYAALVATIAAAAGKASAAAGA